MNKYIDADRLMAEIKRQIRLEELNFAALGGGGQTFCINTLEWVLKRIDSLQKGQPEADLEKEIDACWQNWLSPSNQKEVEGVLPKTEFAMYARHFAEWQSKQDKETIELAEDHAYLAGSVNEREKMMKEAEEGTVTCHNLNRYILVSGLDESLTYGDKVRIIILPKED